jgi:hypothetical protein
MAQRPSRQRGLESDDMLPGLRFLLVAIVLSLSMLVFGLGAAALLRSAHEEFTSLPTRRSQPETVFAQQPAGPATLALLRVDSSVADPGGANPSAVPDRQGVTAPPEQPSRGASTEPDERAVLPDRVAALTDAAPPDQTTRSDEAPVRTAADTPVPLETEKLESNKPEPRTETTAAVDPDPATPMRQETIVAVPVPAAAPMDDGARAAARRIATLGGPEVVIDPRAVATKPAAASGPRAHHRLKKRRVVRHRVVVPPQPAAFGLFDTAPQPTVTPPSRKNANAQAGPVATAGPSGRPHSAHDPS